MLVFQEYSTVYSKSECYALMFCDKVKSLIFFAEAKSPLSLSKIPRTVMDTAL